MKKSNLFSNVWLWLCLVLVTAACEDEVSQDLPVNGNKAAIANQSNRRLMNFNPGFERGLEGWSVYENPRIANDAIVRVEANSQARFGDRHLFMRLPASAKLNQSEYIHVGQRLKLSNRKRYRYSAHVKWVNPQNSLPSAIVSLWARNVGDGSYNGKDVWIRSGDNYQFIEFEFTPNQSGEVFCYVSLLTHQNGFDNTDIYVDALRIEEIGEAASDTDPRPTGQNLLANSSFDQGLEQWRPTQNNPQGVGGLTRSLIAPDGDRKLRLSLPKAASTTLLNQTWTGVYQQVTLYAGNQYELAATVDRVVPQGTEYPTIVNMFAYKPATQQSDEAWLGSVDYKFNRAEPHPYSQVISVTETTNYIITARVFGWGNDGHPLTVDLDNITLKRVK